MTRPVERRRRHARGIGAARRTTVVAAGLLSLVVLGLPDAAALAAGRSAAQPAGWSTEPAAGRSAPAVTDSLSLPLALALAARHSPLYDRVEARLEVARGEVRSAGQRPNPTLEYRRENLGSPLDPDEFFTAYLPIDVTGRRVQLGRATGRATARLLAERDAARQDAALAVARGWVAAVLAAELAEVAAAQHDAALLVARLEATRAAEGVSSEAAARRTRVESARLAHARALAEARLAQEQGALAALLGVAADSLPPLPRAGGDGTPFGPAALPAQAGALLAELAALDDGALQARAAQDRAELRAAAFAREEAGFRRAFERGGVLGDWELQGGSKLTGGFFTGQVGLAVPLALFHRNEGARERAAGAVRDADAASRATSLAVSGEVRAAAAALRRLTALAADLAAAPDDALVIATAARAAYAEGHMTLLELLDALRAAAEARATAHQYAADLLLARLTLARAVGAPILGGAMP
jgi:cobalt-zinc-cadmium efflux system outer membrane protein